MPRLRCVSSASCRAGSRCLAAAGAPRFRRRTRRSRDLRPGGSTAEGDPDFREVIFLSVPDGLEDRLYLRVFDPDTAASTTWSTRRPTIPRCASRYWRRGRVHRRRRGRRRPGAEQLAAGTALGEQVVAASAALDDRWQTLFSVAADQGEAVGGRRDFRLQVEGVAGGDAANLYGVTLSLRDRRNLAPQDLEIVDFAPTARVPTRRGSPSCASACRRTPRR